MENTFESKNYRYNCYRMMMKKRTIMLLGLLLTVLTAVAGGTVKVACVGNSVTWGMTIPDREENCYPAQLQRMLGSGYEVRNFGHSGATLLRHGHRPYVEQKEYQEALDFKADLVVIHLGLNDTDPRNWPEHSEEFNADYIRLIDSFFRVNPKAKIWICLMTPIFDRHPRFESSTRDWYAAIQRHIRQIASTGKTSLIDLHPPLYGRPDLFADAIHPNAEGAGIIARTVYGTLTGKHGGLVLPPLYTDGMVFQRNEPVVFRGSADAGETVKVDFNGRVRSAVTDGAGKWSVTFPAVISNGRKTVTISEIYVGEVWLCSGQSNMELPVCAVQSGERDLEVHYRNKKPVGERLALQALHHCYGYGLVSEGPVCLSVFEKGNGLCLKFSHARSLSARSPSGSDSRLLGFEVAGADGIYYPADASILQPDAVTVFSSSVAHLLSVRYGWQPFTRANLVNEAGLPCSTFQRQADGLSD